MNSRRLLLILATALTLYAQADVTLQRAMRKETLEGDLKGAIALYEKTVAEAKSDRAIAAKALIRMAECHQKLGDAQAQKIYERVVRDYPDQKDEAAIARTKIGVVASNGAVVTRQVWTGPKVRLGGTVSTDGKFVSYTDRTTGDLMLHDLTTGEDRRLDAAGDGKADLSNISPNGRRVAYVWMKGGIGELRLVETRPGGVSTPRVLYRNPDVRYPGPWAWSADNQTIAVQLQRLDRTVQIALVSANDGSVRILKTVGWGGAGSMAMSPDGKFLAYDINTDPESRHSDIRLIATDGSQDRAVVTDPNSSDTPVNWTPDGHHLLYFSNRDGRRSLYALPMDLGKPAGTPKLVRENLSNLMGLTKSGTIFYGEFSSGANLVTATIDLATGKLQSTPTAVAETPYEGVWSPDGRFLAAGIPTASPGQFWGIRIRSLETSQTRELAPKLRYVRGFCWIGNSGQLFVNGTDLKGRRGLFRLDSQTGEAQTIELASDIRRPNFARRELQPKCTPDGTHAIYERVSEKPETGAPISNIVSRDLATGAEREILQVDTAVNDLRSFALSPDGAWIAYALAASEQLGASVTVGSTTTGESRELVVPGKPGILSVSDWTHDGNFLIVRKAENTSAQSGAEFFLLPAQRGGAKPVAISLPTTGARGLTIHPDGKRIAYVSPKPVNRALVALDNALTVLDNR